MTRVARKTEVKPKYYAVRRGREPGIYTSWAECQRQVKRFRRCRYKGFPTRAEAEAFMDGVTHPSTTGPEKNTEGSKLERSLQAVVEKLWNMGFGNTILLTRSHSGFNLGVLPAAMFTSGPVNASDPSLGSSPSSSTASSVGSRSNTRLKPAVSFARKSDPQTNFDHAMEDEYHDPFDDSEDEDKHGYSIPIPDYEDDDIFGDDW
ncbi:ribonuclease h1 [Fusarium flagelliforme]|uniref:ribonuclease H n=1 Tax=Fusarium flagelliforme TaxID=2675880 RepID=A0A395MKU5_9HYPO|nr:ribonuclease h1 [Fusarium flagelliforme]